MASGVVIQTTRRMPHANTTEAREGCLWRGQHRALRRQELVDDDRVVEISLYHYVDVVEAGAVQLHVSRNKNAEGRPMAVRPLRL